MELRLLVNGRPMREYPHKGMSFIEARHGTNYTVKIKNDNAYRVMAVLSVDGLDVITGKPAEDANKGYIIDAYSYVEIKGYRISDTNSAAFIFTGKGKSYVANAKGSSRNCGVIGVRVFKEKAKPVPTTIINQPTYVPYPVYVYPWNPYYTGGYWVSNPTYGTIAGTGNITLQGGSISLSGTATAASVTPTVNTMTTSGGSATYTANVSANSIGKARAGALSRSTDASNSGQNSACCVSNAFDAPISYKSFDTGTGWGQKLEDKVKKEYFERGEILTELVMYYASKNALIDMGIDLEDDPRIAEHPAPQAFGTKYCQPPQGWQG